MKKSIISFFLICAFSSMGCFAQSADMKITQYINDSDWFGLDAEYTLLKDSVQTKWISLMAETMLAMSFNRHEEAISLIDEILNNYQNEAGFANVMNFVISHSVLNGMNGHYAAAADMAKSFMDQLKAADYPMDYSTFESLYQSYDILRDYPTQHIIRPDEDVSVPMHYKSVLKTDTTGVSELLFIPVMIKGKEYDFIFDTGAGTTFVSGKFADEVGIPVVEDSVYVRGTMYGAYSKKGFIDTLKIGDISFCNVVTVIGAENALDSLADIDAIIGMDFIKLIGEVQIDNENQQIVFPKDLTPLPETGRNYMTSLVNESIISLKTSDGRNLLMTFDTGSNSNDFSNNYYLKHREEVEAIAVRDTVTQGSYGDLTQYEVLKMPAVTFYLGDKDFTVSHISVNLFQDGIQNDGTLGLPLFKAVNKTIINTKDMFVEIQ